MVAFPFVRLCGRAHDQAAKTRGRYSNQREKAITKILFLQLLGSLERDAKETAFVKTKRKSR